MTDRLHLPLTVLAIWVCGPVDAAPQGTDWPEAGDRLRISSEEISGEYTVAELLAESLVVQTDSASQRFAVPAASLDRLEVYRGETSRLKGFLLGSLAGGLLGGFWALPCTSQPHFTCKRAPPGHRAAIAVGVGALVGAAVWGGREIWEEVRLRGQPTGDFARTLLASQDEEANGNLDTISREEIAALADWDAMEIVRRLRPGWLRPRIQATFRSALSTDAALNDDASPIPDPAVYPEVFEDDFHYGPAESLRQFHAGEIERLERISALDATTRYGTGYLAGIIRVVIRR